MLEKDQKKTEVIKIVTVQLHAIYYEQIPLYISVLFFIFSVYFLISSKFFIHILFNIIVGQLIYYYSHFYIKKSNLRV